jgi:hypothetical protein
MSRTLPPRPLRRTLAGFSRVSLDLELDAIHRRDASEALAWLCYELHTITDLTEAELMAYATRLAYGHTLEGDREDWGAYAQPHLTHISPKLHALDVDGTTARLWETIRDKWPWFWDAVQEDEAARSKRRGQGDNSALPTREGAQNPPPPPPPPEQIPPCARAVAFVYTTHTQNGTIPTITDIAKAIGVSRTSLYEERFDDLRNVLTALRASKAPPRGRRDKKGNLEAVDE